MTEPGLRFLSAADVVRALPMKDAVEAMRDAFRQLSTGPGMFYRSHIVCHLVLLEALASDALPCTVTRC